MGSVKDLRHLLPPEYKNREYGTVPPDTTREPFRWVSEISYKNVHRIVARGYDTTELMMAGYGLVDVLFVVFQSRIPTIEEAKMLDYILIMALEDGLSSPAVISRIVAKSNAILTQAAAASVLAFGHTYGAFQDFGNMLNNYLSRAEKEGKTLEEIAEILVKEIPLDKILGVSDLCLKDPAPKRILQRAEDLGVAGKYIKFIKEIAKAAQKVSEKPIDVDMLGAIGATMMDLGFSPEATWGIIAVTRAFAAGAHYIEEVERGGFLKYGQTLTPKELYDGPSEKPVPPIEERNNIAKPAVCRTLEEWKKAITERQKLYGSGWKALASQLEENEEK